MYEICDQLLECVVLTQLRRSTETVSSALAPRFMNPSRPCTTVPSGVVAIMMFCESTSKDTTPVKSLFAYS